jgi:adenylate cyclase
MVDAKIERRLTAIVQADVVGYSRLIGLDEEGTIARLQALRSELIDPQIAEHGGRIVKSMGDGLLLEFSSVVNATRCAVNIQADMAARNVDESDERRIEFRIGINLGDVVVEGDDIHGDGVNVAARLEGLADAGGISMSRAARDQVLDKLDVGLEDLGEIEIKNIARPVQVFRVVLDGGHTVQPAPGNNSRRYAIAAAVFAVIVGGGLAGWFKFGATDVEPAAIERMAHALPDKPSIAVLPFDNMSSDKEQDYFADGMIEDLITDLSKVPGLFVIARNSTFTYKGKSVKVQQVAEDLGVRYVVEGSVRRIGDKLRINVQLINALSGHHVWAERYDGAMANIFELQDRITKKIVTALAGSLLPGKANAAATKETDNPAAYDAVLLGWNYLRQRRIDPENYVLAHQQFEKALQLDPNYNRAHLYMAATYWWASWHERFIKLGVDFQEGVDRANGYLKTAMKSPSPLGHQLRAEMFRWYGQFDKAVAEADRAITLDANNPEAHSVKGYAQLFAGQTRPALKSFDLADRLDPENTHSRWMGRGIARLFLGENKAAVRLLKLAVAKAPNNDWSYQWLIAAYGHLGRTEEAKTAINIMDELRRNSSETPYTQAFAVGNVRLKKARDKDLFLLGLEKAGVAAGGDPGSAKRDLDTIVSRTKEGHFQVAGAATVDARQAKKLLDQGVTFFDVRGPGPWRAGHIKGAFWATKTIGDFSHENLAKIVDKNQPVCFYCSGFT